jgi:hypothetical protein
MNWVKKNRDLVITLAVFIVLVLLLSLYGMFGGGNKHDETLLPRIEEEVKIALPSSSQGEATAEDTAAPTTTSFFLHPSATELLGKLENLNYQEFKAETKNLPGLRVMWPAYFFSIMNITTNKAEVMLDASEDGFGVVLLTEIDLEQYPQIRTLERGQKIWIAGEITGVDPTGTGQFFLTAEYIRFDDYSPRARPSQAEEKSE